MRYGLDITSAGEWGRPDQIAELAALAEPFRLRRALVSVVTDGCTGGGFNPPPART